MNVEGRELKLSNLPKVLYPGSSFTKRDLIGYYAQIAPAILPASRRPRDHAHPLARRGGRQVVLPEAGTSAPAVLGPTAPIATSSRTIDYIQAGDLATLVWLANSAAIELHAPLARASAPERPTALVFDLDPGAPASIVECCHVASLLAGMFENLAMMSCAKTSGSKGLQVYVPLNVPDVTFDDTKPFARAVAEMLADAEPDLIVSNMKRERRTGKGADRLEPERPQQDDGVRLLSAGDRRADGLHARELGGGARRLRRRRTPRACRSSPTRCSRRVTSTGDMFAPVLTHVQELPGL